MNKPGVRIGLRSEQIRSKNQTHPQMKIPAILTCSAGRRCWPPCRCAAPRRRKSPSTYFYNNLADDGDWYNTPEYGYVWQPSIAYKIGQVAAVHRRLLGTDRRRLDLGFLREFRLGRPITTAAGRA